MAEADKLYRDAYLAILAEWDVEGSVFLDRLPRLWIKDQGLEISVREVGYLMYEHLRTGGKLDQVVEKREPFKRWCEFHFDFRIAVCGMPVYIETVLNEEKRFERHIHIVNMHKV